MRRLSCFLLFLFLVPSARSADLDKDALKKIAPALEKFVEGQQISGAVAVVGNSKGIARVDAVGTLDLDGKKPMTTATVFRIASMTKPIVAVAIMILVEEGKLKLDDPIEKHLPEFRGQLVVDKREKDGTVVLKKPKRLPTLRDLLTHTSGLAPFPPGLADIYAKRDRTLAEMTLVISQRPLEFEPGAKWSYCNSGIDTLGRIIEVVSGVPFEEFMQKRIFDPVGMKSTSFYEVRGTLARLYGEKEGKLVPAPDSLIGPGKGTKHPIPAGGLYSTGEDLARLYQVMLSGGLNGGSRLLTEASIKEMTRVQTNDLQSGFTPGMGFGLGWAVVKKPDGVTAMLSDGTYGHGGAFGTQAWLDPKRDLFVILLIQRTGLKNADASEMRKTLQQLAVDAIK